MIEIDKVTEDSFCWRLMYLHISLIQCCRYLCGNRCICTGLIFAVADIFFETDVSATYFSLNLQILFSLSVMYNCIYILLFLGFEDTSFANFTSASHIFYDLRMLLIEILHPQPALSRPCGYSPIKMCILENPLSQISPPISFKLLFTSQLEPIYCLQKN